MFIVLTEIQFPKARLNAKPKFWGFIMSEVTNIRLEISFRI